MEDTKQLETPLNKIFQPKCNPSIGPVYSRAMQLSTASGWSIYLPAESIPNKL